MKDEIQVEAKKRSYSGGINLFKTRKPKKASREVMNQKTKRQKQTKRRSGGGF